MSIERDRIFIDLEDKDLYAALQKEPLAKGRENKELFFLAMAIGFSSCTRLPISKKEGYFRIEYLTDRDKALMNSLAIHASKSVESLADPAAVYEIAEAYAHAGIHLLIDMIKSTSFEGFDKRFEKEITELLSNVG
jgi:hypothetical protein